MGAIVASFVAAAVSAYAQTPTAADFAVCNADAQVAVKAGTTTPTTKDYVKEQDYGRERGAILERIVRPGVGTGGTCECFPEVTPC